MLIFFQTLSTKGWQVDPARYELPGKDFFLHTARPIRKDRASLGSFPGPIDDWRDVASSTRYIRTRHPQEFLQKGKHEHVVRWLGLGGHPS